MATRAVFETTEQIIPYDKVLGAKVTRKAPNGSTTELTVTTGTHGTTFAIPLAGESVALFARGFDLFCAEVANGGEFGIFVPIATSEPTDTETTTETTTDSDTGTTTTTQTGTTTTTPPATPAEVKKVMTNTND